MATVFGFNKTESHILFCQGFYYKNVVNLEIVSILGGKTTTIFPIKYYSRFKIVVIIEMQCTTLNEEI